MKKIYEELGYEIWTTKSGKTFLVLDIHGDCVFSTTTERKAKNFLNKMFKNNGMKK